MRKLLTNNSTYYIRHIKSKLYLKCSEFYASSSLRYTDNLLDASGSVSVEQLYSSIEYYGIKLDTNAHEIVCIDIKQYLEDY